MKNTDGIQPILNKVLLEKGVDQEEVSKILPDVERALLEHFDNYARLTNELPIEFKTLEEVIVLIEEYIRMLKTVRTDEGNYTTAQEIKIKEIEFLLFTLNNLKYIYRP